MSDLGLTPLYSGKVRDLYEVDDRHLLMVATDRLSAFDVVMAETIPEKGSVLTGLTNYWINEFGQRAPSALVSCDPQVIESTVPGFLQQTQWHGRAMLVRKAEMFPLECIVRGRLAGSAHDEYVARGTVHEMIVPPGLQLTDAFASRCSRLRSRRRRAMTSTSASNARHCWRAPNGSTTPRHSAWTFHACGRSARRQWTHPRGHEV